MSSATPIEAAPRGSTGFFQVEHWAAIVGAWSFPDDGSVRYEGPGQTDVAVAYGIARSSLRFRDGIIRTKLKLKQTTNSSAGVVVGFQSPERPYIGVALGAFNRAYSVFEFRPDGHWEHLESVGLIGNLRSNHDYALEVRVEGQRIRATVDGVDVVETVLHRPLHGTGFGLYAFDKSPVTFSSIEVRNNPPRAFVVMPFREPFDTLYREVIRPVAEDMEFQIVRVDEVAGPGLILDDIRRQIEEAHLIVAEISLPNPNVFYELGYAHALRKPAVLLVRREDGNSLPFDIRGYRAIFYDDTIGGKNAVEHSLRNHLEAIRRDF